MSQTAAQLHEHRIRTGRKPKPVHLDPDDERLLREIVESPYWAEWQVRRAKVILARAGGGRIIELIPELGYSRASIKRTCRTFEREGVAGLMARRLRTRKAREHGRGESNP